MNIWPEIRDGGWLEDILSNVSAVNYWRRIFEWVYSGRLNTWAYRWSCAIWAQSGLTVLPNVNLVSNIGFDSVATHTMKKSELTDMATEAMDFPIRHPPFVIRDAQADNFTQGRVYSINLENRARLKIKKLLGDVMRRKGTFLL